MCLKHTMHNRDVCAGDLVHRDVPGLVALVRRVCKEEQVAAVEGGFHRSAVLKGEVSRGRYVLLAFRGGGFCVKG
jgi:hypothetical protein